MCSTQRIPRPDTGLICESHIPPLLSRHARTFPPSLVLFPFDCHLRHRLTRHDQRLILRVPAVRADSPISFATGSPQVWRLEPFRPALLLALLSSTTISSACPENTANSLLDTLRRWLSRMFSGQVFITQCTWLRQTHYRSLPAYRAWMPVSSHNWLVRRKT